jgi:hypothetical protein
MEPEEELRELTADSIEGILTLLDVMAGDPPEGFDFAKHLKEQKEREKRSGELVHMILNRDAILSSQDLPKELVSVPEWGGEVYVRALTGAERDQFEASMIEQRGKKQSLNMANIRAKLAAMTICDEQGKRLFTDADVHALAGKSASALNRVFEAARRLSGLAEDDVDELAKGLEENPFGGSPTA